MPTLLDSLMIRLGFSIDPKGLEGFAKMAEQAKGMALGITGAISGAVYGIEHMVKSAAERMGGIQNFSEQMGISARSVDALGKVARENDSSLEAMEGALRSLTSMAGQAAMGVGRGRMLFQKFGISVKDANGNVKTTEQLLGDVADRMAKLPTIAQRNALGGRLGFDPATIYLLSQGRANFERLRAEAMAANPFAEQDYANADATEKLFRKAGDSVTKLKTRIAVALMPTVNDLLKRFIEWTKNSDNIAKIQHAITKVVEVAKLLWEHSGKILAIFGVFYAHKYGAMFMEWGAQIGNVAAKLKTGAGAAEALKAGLGGIRGILTGGLIAAFALVAEDLWIFYQGGTSVTGWLLTKFPYAVEVAKGALAVLGSSAVALATGSGPLGLLVAGIGGLVIAAQSLRDAWNPLKQWWEELWNGFYDTVANWYNDLPLPVRVALGWTTGGQVFGGMTGGKMATSKSIREQQQRVNEGFGKPWLGLEDETNPSWLARKPAPSAVTVPPGMYQRPEGVGTWGTGVGLEKNEFHFGDIHFNAAGNLDSPEVARKHSELLIKEIQRQTRGKSRDQTRNGQSGVR